MNCRDYLHFKVCYEMATANNADEFNTMFAERCGDFTNRSEWVHLPCERVYFICDKNTKYAMIMSKSIKDLSIREIEKIDKSGYYFSTKEKAEKALEE